MTCCNATGKRIFARRSQASRAIKQLERVNRAGRPPRDKVPTPMRPYQCNHCGGWHIGHRKPERWSA